MILPLLTMFARAFVPAVQLSTPSLNDILQQTGEKTGSVAGRAVAKDEAHIAVATGANSFVVVETSSLGREVQIGERSLCGNRSSFGGL